jgi:hypothetical protein
VSLDADDKVISLLERIATALEAGARQRLTAAEVARISRCDRARVVAALRGQTLRGAWDGKKWSVYRDDAEAWIRAHCPVPTQKRGRPRKPVPEDPAEAIMRIPLKRTSGV